MKSKSSRSLAACFALAAIICVLAGRTGAAASIFKQPANNVEKYPYHSHKFDQLISESQRFCRGGKVEDFYNWMDLAYRDSSRRFPGRENLTLEQLLEAKRKDLGSISDREKKTQVEIALLTWMHRMIKGIIPKFSLDRGFEFCNVIRYGERQCFLQSVLIAGLLQDMGVDAGVEMVYKNEHSQQVNNAHAVTLVKLPNGQDIVVDASEPYPFPYQKGLFVRYAGYSYVDPVYAPNSHRILRYLSAAGHSVIPASSVRTMDYAFVRSQFYYYRGERVSGGVIYAAKTPAGLEEAARNFRTSVNLCPSNPLAVYMLGRTYFAQGKPKEAMKCFQQAQKLYARFGWVPPGLREYSGLAMQLLAPKPVVKQPSPKSPAPTPAVFHAPKPAAPLKKK